MFALRLTLIVAIIGAQGLCAAPQEMTFVVETVVAKEEPFAFKRRYIGTINAEYFSLLRPQMSGTIDEINVKANQQVKKGQHLFSLDNSPLKKAVELDQKHLNLAKAAYLRKGALRKTNDITRAQLEEAEMAMLFAEQKLAESKKALKNSEVVAPFDGVVGVPRVVMGQSVTPKDTLISIKQGYYFISLRIPASRLKEIAVGQPVLVNSETVLVDAVEKSIDPHTRTGFARATLKECPRCIVGSSAFAELTIEDNPQAIMLTRNAIFYKKGKPYVVKVESDKSGITRADIKEISVGLEQEGMVQIKTGVLAGDLIVKANPKRLSQGARLKVVS